MRSWATKNWGLFIVVFMAVGAGVVAANTYNDGAAFVDFQDYDSPDQACRGAQEVREDATSTIVY